MAGTLDRILDEVDFSIVHENYTERERVHRLLLRRLKAGQVDPFAVLALGIDDAFGNFSAHQHGLGPLVLAQSPARRVFELAQRFLACRSCAEVPEIVRDAGIPFLKIGVGSEMAALLRPKEFWITNVRSVWAHLVVKHGGNASQANAELALYRDDDRDSEMDYAIWGALHKDLEPAMRAIAEEGARKAEERGLTAGKYTFLWADALANEMYELRDNV